MSKKLIMTPKELFEAKRAFKQKIGVPLLTPAELAAIQATYEYNSKVMKEQRDEEYRSNAQVQRWNSLTKEERAREAIDKSTESIRTFNDWKEGRDTTEEEARKKAVELARRSDRDKEG